MDHSSFFIVRGVYVTKVLNAIHCVNIHIQLKGLTEGLDLFGPSPDPILPTACHLGIETLFVDLHRRRIRACRRRGGRGVFDGRCCSSPGGPSLSTNCCYKAHKVILVCGDVICKTGTDFLAMGEIAVNLIG